MAAVAVGLFGSVLALCLGAACALLGPPEWVVRPPADPAHVYGIGSAGTTYEGNPARAREIAHQRALDDLARRIRERMLAEGLLPESAGSTPSDDIRFTEQDLEAVDLVSVWVDVHGRSGPENQTWVLLRVPEDRARLIATRTH